MAVETKRAARRKLRFETFEQMWAEVERIVAAERAGTLRRTGNWSTGQVLGHLATWIEFAVDGYPPNLRPPLLIKLILKRKKRQFVSEGMPAGVRIPRIEGGTLGTEALSAEAGAAKLKRAWEQLLAKPPTTPNPIFGPLTHQEWIAVNLRHAELHLGFLHP